MGIQSDIFSTEYNTRSFTSTKHIATKAHMAVWLEQVSDGNWVQMDSDEYELINNSAVLESAPNTVTYSQVEIRVADTPNELLSSISDIAIVASNVDAIDAVSESIEDVNVVADNIDSINNVKGNMTHVYNVSSNMTKVAIVSGNMNKVLRVEENIDDINIVKDNILDINTNADNIADINVTAEAIRGGGEVTGGQFTGGGLTKPLMYTSKLVTENTTISSGINALAIDSYTINDGFTLTIEDTSVLKVV